MRKATYFILLLLCTCLASASANTGQRITEAQPDTFPVPKNIKGMLFYVQRDPNTNTVVYELNKSSDGGLDEEEPVHPFWIRYPEGGVQKELNYVQRKFAYGLHTKKLGKENYELKFVCYDKLALNLRKGADGNYHVYTTIDKREVILDRIFVRVEGGTFWVPNVLYVELKGKDAATGKAVAGRFKP